MLGDETLNDPFEAESDPFEKESAGHRDERLGVVAPGIDPPNLQRQTKDRSYEAKVATPSCNWL